MNILQKIKDYVLGDGTEPFVLHGPSGCGKTSIMAAAAKQTWNWIETKKAVFIRLESCVIMRLLFSVLSGP